MSENCVFSPSGQVLGHFRTFFRHFSDILSTFPFSELSNDVPVTSLVPRPFRGAVLHHGGRAQKQRIEQPTPPACYRSLSGCLWGPSGPRAPECPKSVPRVSPECQKGVPDIPGTLSGHFLDTPEPRAQRAPEPQNSQADYFLVWNCLADCFVSLFSLMKLAWWSWASGYQTNLSLCFVGKLLPD